MISRRGARYLILISVILLTNGFDFSGPKTYGRAISSPVSWWAADGDPSDSVGSNDGVLSNGASFTTGKAGQAFNLDGSDDHVYIGNPDSLRISSGLTLAAWVKPDVTPPLDNSSRSGIYSIVTKWGQASSSDAYGLWLNNPDGVTRLLGAIGRPGLSDGGQYGGTIPAGNWTHVAMTYDSATGQNIFYVNGAQVAQRVLGGTILASDQNVLIGAEDSTLARPFNGAIDEIQIYDRALSASEIGDLAQVQRVYVPMVARNYCSGPIVDDFSNPASGWFTGETSSWSYSYTSGEYRMLAKKQYAVGLVSRGEKPTGPFVIEVDARRASSVTGTAGLVFGLTDDWSDFYTFEVYPSAQQWYIWHFSNGNWWPVVYGSSGSIQQGQSYNRLRLQTVVSGGLNANFYVNGVYLTSLYYLYDPASPRRVGLTATSDATGFDARFDNYKLVLEGCPESGVAGSLGSAEMPENLFESTR